MIFAETERLILRRAVPDDLEPLLESWGNPESTRYMEEKPDIRGFLTAMPAEHRRQEHAAEAVAAIIDLLVEQHAIHRFVAVSAAENTASIALLRSLGFRQEGHFRQSFFCNGEWIDDACFALLASEWTAIRRRGR